MSLLAILPIVVKRIFNNLVLVLSTLFGLVVSVGLFVSIPLYADAINERMVRDEFRATASWRRPTASILLRYDGGPGHWATIEDYQKLDAFVTGQAAHIIGLPVVRWSKNAKTDYYQVYSHPETKVLNPKSLIRWGPIAFYIGLEPYMTIVNGRYPTANLGPEGEIEVMISLAASDQSGLRIGDRLIVKEKEQFQPHQADLRIVGIWEPKSKEQAFGFDYASPADDALIVAQESFFSHVQERFPKGVNTAGWYLVFDGDQVHSDNMGRIVAGIYRLRTDTGLLLSGSRLGGDAFEWTLVNSIQRAWLLKVLLYIFSVPIVAIILYYITIAAGLSIERQRNEIAVLKSRGAATPQILGIYLLEGLLIGAIAIAVGPALGRLMAELIGRTSTFLLFTNKVSLPVTISADTYRYTFIAVGLSIAASLLPATVAARYTVIGYRQEAVRASRAPFWQRYFLDLIVLLAAIYGYYTLRQRGAILSVGPRGPTEDPFNNPLLVVVPALFIFGVTLVFVRLFPFLVELGARLGARLLGVSVLLGLRHMARTPGHYSTLVLLLTLTLALGAFSASVARTLDENYAERVYYQNGADVRMVEFGDFMEGNRTVDSSGNVQSSGGGSWSFTPVEDHLEIPGIWAVSRVRTYEVNTLDERGRRNNDKSQLLGIDRATFPQVAYFRRDFAPSSLGTLMNVLGSNDAAALISLSFAYERQLAPGDAFRLYVEGAEIEFVVGDIIDYFPTLYPREGSHFFVANLDHIFDQSRTSPYNVFLKTDPKLDMNVAVQQLDALGFDVMDWDDSRSIIRAQRADQRRTGLFGLLSIGFIVSATLTVVGFLLYSFLSFRRRFVQLGVLRAIGLSVWQLVSLLVFEQALLIVTGVVAGTALGVATGLLFIPFLQVGEDVMSRIPAFRVITAWDDIFQLYGVLGIMLGVAIAVLAWRLVTLKVYQAVKLGDTEE